ncbi:MAG: hypothetical protein ABWZ99_00895 [Ilumatobacteraceae bacterium]
MHPLYAALIAAADGTFPAVDGGVDVCEPDAHGATACVEFTGHSFVLTTHEPAAVIACGADGYGGATQPDLLRWLAGPRGTIGSHDAVLVARGRGGGGRRVGGGRGGARVRERTDLDDHPRVRRARHHRRDVRVYADDHGLITIGHGLVGRREVSVELFDPDLRAVVAPPGAGGALIDEALHLVPSSDLVWAQVAPGNAASLRAFLRCGFVPIGAEVLFEAEPPGRASPTAERTATGMSWNDFVADM